MKTIFIIYNINKSFMKCLLCAKYFIYINSLNFHHNTMREFPSDRGRNWGSMGFYKVVNSGNRIKIQVCLTLHYASHLPQGSLVSMSSLRAQGQVVKPPVGRLREVTSAWAHRGSPPGFAQPMRDRCSKCLATHSSEPRRPVGEKNGQEQQGKLSS